MKTPTNTVQNAGLGLRRCFAPQIADCPPRNISFYEVAPENWIRVGGKLGKQFRALSEQFDFVCHGLSLSLGASDPLDEKFIAEVKNFLHQHQIKRYSEHLSYCSHNGHLYDLLPIPFTEEAVHHVAARIRRTQDILEQKIAVENVSYYAAPGQQMTEIDFFNAVVTEADCDILLDLNNIYVNSTNHNYNAEQFLRAIPSERIAWAHIAGHFVEGEDFLIDTHGADVIDPVWQLLAKAYELYGVFPTLLERDFNIPPLPQLLGEVDNILQLQDIARHKKIA